MLFENLKDHFFRQPFNHENFAWVKIISTEARRRASVEWRRSILNSGWRSDPQSSNFSKCVLSGFLIVTIKLDVLGVRKKVLSCLAAFKFSVSASYIKVYILSGIQIKSTSLWSIWPLPMTRFFKNYVLASNFTFKSLCTKFQLNRKNIF